MPNDSRDPGWLKYQQDLKSWEIWEQHRADWHLESFKAVVQFASTAIKTLLLVNGGAVIAMLALLGNLWTKESNGQVVAQRVAGLLQVPMSLFVAGLVAAAMTAAGAYLSQHFFSHKWDRTGRILQWASVAFAAAGIASFAGGAYCAVGAFSVGLRS